MKVFETLVQSDLDEKSLATIEQVIRLNRSQYRLLQQLDSNYPELVPRLSPLDRVDDKNAAILTETIEQAAPPTALVHDLFLKLGYLDWPATLPVDSRELLRLLAVLVLTPHELTAWFSLYQGGEVSRGDRAQLARELVDSLGPGSIGPDERQTRLEAVPLPAHRRFLTDASPEEIAEPAAAAADSVPWPLLATVAVSGASAMVYEVACGRTLSMVYSPRCTAFPSCCPRFCFELHSGPRSPRDFCAGIKY